MHAEEYNQKIDGEGPKRFRCKNKYHQQESEITNEKANDRITCVKSNYPAVNDYYKRGSEIKLTLEYNFILKLRYGQLSSLECELFDSDVQRRADWWGKRHSHGRHESVVQTLLRSGSSVRVVVEQPVSLIQKWRRRRRRRRGKEEGEGGGGRRGEGEGGGGGGGRRKGEEHEHRRTQKSH